MTTSKPILAALFAVYITPLVYGHDETPSAQTYEGEFGYIGTVDLPITTRATSVQQRFNYALAQYCHMSYETARDAFAALLGEDPECAMAYWGIAMTHTAPV